MYTGIVLPEEGRHLTLLYHGHNETKRAYRGALAATADAAHEWDGRKINLTFGDVGHFPESKCWYVAVTSDSLHEFRELLAWHMDKYGIAYSKDFSFTPHVTLAYHKEPKRNPYQGLRMPVEEVSVVSNAFGTRGVLM